MTWLYGWERNPLHQPGTIAVAMLLVLLVTGVYLTVFYRVAAPWEAVSRLHTDPWLGAWIRSLHRYATDVFVVAALLHAFRILVQARSWGPRTLAWISGLALLGAGMVCAWTGFVMAWDTFGERLALDGTRLLDSLPIFSEPLARIFAGDNPVPSAFFFVNLFMHIALPLAIGAGLWLHVSRLARPTLLPPRRLMWAIIGLLTLAAVVFPATLGPRADPLHLTETTPTDVIVAWWLPLTERSSPLLVWTVTIALAGLVLAVPWLTRHPREARWAASAVDARHCTGCDQCPQDCPWEAITMVARHDDRTTLLAHVDPARCVSCGICAGSCAPMGVGPPGRTGRDQLAAVRRLLPLPPEPTTGTPAPVAICCSEAPPSHVEALRDRGAYVHAVTCVGNLHSSVIEWFIRSGAPGVLVCGCPPRDCIGREGPKWLRERLFHDREAELQPRVDRRRVRLATLAPGDLRGALATFEAFQSELATLEPLQPEIDADIDPVCEAVAVREAIS